jgi:hypothetical protein
MKRWLHSNAVWPPAFAVIAFVIGYGLVEATLWFIESLSRHPGARFEDDTEIGNIRTGIVILASCFYAFYRLRRFHPVWNAPYASWLQSSPWTARKPLPLGPVHLVWQDAVVIGALCVLAHRSEAENTLVPLLTFGLLYLLGMTVTLGFTRTWAPCLVLGFLWPAFLLLPGMMRPPAAGLVTAIVVVIAYGHFRSLQTFPWKKGGDVVPAVLRLKRAKSPLEVEIRIESLSESPSGSAPRLGWPFASLSPKGCRKPIAASTSLALSALFGWWTYCATTGLDAAEIGPLLLIFGFIAALLRYVIYCAAVVPPFNIWGRLVSGRLIVPGYDRVCVTPLAVIALATVGTIMVQHSGLWSREVMACWMAALWFALLHGGPTLPKWILTGQHRYRSPARFASSKGALRPI